jgi:hypothetical protein
VQNGDKGKAIPRPDSSPAMDVLFGKREITYLHEGWTKPTLARGRAMEDGEVGGCEGEACNAFIRLQPMEKGAVDEVDFASLLYTPSRELG